MRAFHTLLVVVTFCVTFGWHSTRWVSTLCRLGFRRGHTQVMMPRSERLVKKSASFAKVYFFGQVFDLLQMEFEQNKRRSNRLAAIAAILKAADSSDDLPLYMDRLANGTLASEAEPNRQAQQKTLDALSMGRRDLAVRLSTVENPRRMLAVFALLYRAELSGRDSVGGNARFSKATRLLAEGLRYWMVILVHGKHWHYCVQRLV